MEVRDICRSQTVLLSTAKVQSCAIAVTSNLAYLERRCEIFVRVLRKICIMFVVKHDLESRLRSLADTGRRVMVNISATPAQVWYIILTELSATHVIDPLTELYVIFLEFIARHEFFSPRVIPATLLSSVSWLV
jgi:hypothetical protein